MHFSSGSLKNGHLDHSLVDLVDQKATGGTWKGNSIKAVLQRATAHSPGMYPCRSGCPESPKVYLQT